MEEHEMLSYLQNVEYGFGNIFMQIALHHIYDTINISVIKCFFELWTLVFNFYYNVYCITINVLLLKPITKKCVVYLKYVTRANNQIYCIIVYNCTHWRLIKTSDLILHHSNACLCHSLLNRVQQVFCGLKRTPHWNASTHAIHRLLVHSLLKSHPTPAHKYG